MSPLAKPLCPLAVLALLVAAPLMRGQLPELGEVTAVLFTLDGRTVISAHADGAIVFWDAAKEKERKRLQGHKDGAYALALSPDGKSLASAGGDGLVRIWDVARAREVRQLAGHEKAVVALAFSPDGKTLASGGDDYTIRLWASASGKSLHTLRGHAAKISSLAFTPNGKMLASAGIVLAERGGKRTPTVGDRIHLWDVPKGKFLRQLPVRGEQVVIAPDGRTLAASGRYVDFDLTAKGRRVRLNGGSRLAVWDLWRNAPRWKWDEHGTALTLSADGRYIVSGWGNRLHHDRVLANNGNNSSGAHLWELATGKEALGLTIPEGQATVLAMSPDGTKLAAGQLSGNVKIWGLKPEARKARAAKGLERKQFQTDWRALAAEHAGEAYEAIWALAAGPDKVLPVIRKSLTAAPRAGPAIRRLVADLDGDDFEVREKARKELARLGARAEPYLREALEGRPSLELRRSAQALLDALNYRPDPEELRRERAIAVLERIGTPEAQGLLRGLAKGAPEDRLTRQAVAALRRLAARGPLAP
jgi:WD40 repeat protein